MTPDQAKFLLDYVLPTLRSETATTARVMAAIPNTNLDYRPSERCMPAGELLWHIASADMMFLNGILNGAFASDSNRPAHTETPEQISAWYTATTGEAIAKLAALTPEQAAQTLDFHGFLQAPAAGFIDFALRHSIHHRGQLSSYIRPMGGKVPAIYGPSADEDPFAPKVAAA